MKSPNNWKKLNKVVLRVDNAEILYTDKLSIMLDCGFENITKGRCTLKINLKDKRKNNLFVHTDKALMSVELFYSKTEIENKLLINENNYLFIKDNLKVGIESIEWKIPLT